MGDDLGGPAVRRIVKQFRFRRFGRLSGVRVAAVMVAAGLIAVSTVPIATPAQAARSFLSFWNLGPNTPAFETVYMGGPINNLNGASFQSPFQGGSYIVDGVVVASTYESMDTDSSGVTISVPSAQIVRTTVSDPSGGGPGMLISCPDNTCGRGLASFTITFTWVGTGRLTACREAWQQSFPNPAGTLAEVCPLGPINWTQTREVRAGPAPDEENREPAASFLAVRSPSDPHEFTFENHSTDFEDDAADLTYSWDFGNGSTSTETNPAYRYPDGGTYTVTLTATDTDGATDVITGQVSVANGLVVNSTGDDGAVDAAARGCDTGSTIGEDVECTLRAAIETANEADGGEITFDIDSASIPAISAESPLPALAAGVVIDGTTQAGGWVAVAGSGDRALELSDGTSKVTGLALGGVETAVLITGGSEHVITGNRLGTNTTGTAADATVFGVAITEAADVEVSANVSGAQLGVVALPSSPRVAVEDNFFGVVQGGTGPLGTPQGGVVVGGADSRIRGNVVRGSGVAIAVLGPVAAGTTVDDNKVGVTASGAALPDSATAIRIDATPDVTVSGNRVAGVGEGLIQVTGSKQNTTNVDGQIDFVEPSSEPLDGAVTGGNVRITGNTLGFAGTDGAGGWGIVTWAGASGLQVTGNTILRADLEAIAVDGGSGHTIADNTLGTEAAPVGTGISLFNAADTRLGGAGVGNRIWSKDHTAIDIQGEAGTPTIEGNEIHSVGDSPWPGISLDGTATTPAVIGNVVTGGDVGISTSTTAEPRIAGNTVTDGSTGIQVWGDGATIADNTVRDQETEGIESRGSGSALTGNSVIRSGVGLVVRGDDVEVSANRVGLERGSDTVLGNLGAGIKVTGGDVEVTRNMVAGSNGPGIDVGETAVANLRANRIWQSADGVAIDAPAGPPAPKLVAVARTGSGETLRRTLVLQDLPEGDAGRIEVFANSSCEDPEARFLMEINRDKAPDETARIIQIKGNESRDHFTVTYTDSDRNTSELSECVSGATYPDGDGDGSIDPLDAILHTDGNPTSAIIATDAEQLLMVTVLPYNAETDNGGGQLEGVSATDDPEPGAHPAGWELPYGAIRFRVTGVTPGGRTTVALTTVSGSGPIVGTGYWKYGPQTTGGAEGWYDFAYDEASDTGAILLDAMDVPGVGIRRAFGLRFADGGRGDSDGAANGTITDPGGPVLVEGTLPTTPPTTPTTTPTITPPQTPDPTTPPAAPDDGTTVASSSLPFTGTNPWSKAGLGAVLVAIGMLGAAAGRRRRATR